MVRSRVGQNILTNYLAIAWMGFLTLGLIPLYLRRLTPGQWGLVALAIAVQGFLGLLDSGLGQIMPRDVARVAGSRTEELRVFSLFARTYLALAALGCVLGQLAVPLLVEHWLNRGNGVEAHTVLALRLVLIQFMFQFANNASTGFWNGVEEQHLANIRQCAFATAKHGGALVAVYGWRADAVGYLLPFAVFSCLEWYANRFTILRRFGDVREHAKPSLRHLRTLAREAGTLAVGILFGMLASQVDRIVLSRAVDAAAFGRYVIVGNLGMAFLQLQYPLMRAYFPRLARSRGAQSTLATSRQLAQALVLLCILPSGLIAILAPFVLRVWISDPKVVSEGTTPLRLILIAVALNTVYQLIYQHIIVRGEGRLLVAINLTALIMAATVTALVAPQLGIIAGGIAWLTISVVQLCFGAIWISQLRRVDSSNESHEQA